MTVGGGEAADQMVRMMLSSGEVAVRLGGSALKNLLALTMALAKNNQTISGKVNMTRMLRETRDLRLFPMSPEQYKQFQRHAKKQKILFSAIKDRDGKGKLVEVIMPVTELDRANLIFERIMYQGPVRQPPERQERPASSPEKGSQERSPDRDRDTPQAPQQAQEGPQERPPEQSRLHPRRSGTGPNRLQTGGILRPLAPVCPTIPGRCRQKKILGRDETRAIPKSDPLYPTVPGRAERRVRSRPSWAGSRGTAPSWTAGSSPFRPGKK